MEHRLEELETKVAFQDQALFELNNVVVQQQREIEQLRKAVEAMRAQLREITPSMIASQAEETPPPHY